MIRKGDKVKIIGHKWDNYTLIGSYIKDNFEHFFADKVAVVVDKGTISNTFKVRFLYGWVCWDNMVVRYMPSWNRDKYLKRCPYADSTRP